MSKRCPSATFVCVARLPDHRLAFTRRSLRRQCGVADAFPTTSEDVWGVVYEVSQDDLEELDRREGIHSNSYRRTSIMVFPDGSEVRALPVETYFAVRQPNPPLPNQQYKELILKGAQSWGLPKWYIAKLQQIEVGE